MCVCVCVCICACGRVHYRDMYWSGDYNLCAHALQGRVMPLCPYLSCLSVCLSICLVFLLVKKNALQLRHFKTSYSMATIVADTSQGSFDVASCCWSVGSTPLKSHVTFLLLILIGQQQFVLCTRRYGSTNTT